jgi:hypothetical protein
MYAIQSSESINAQTAEAMQTELELKGMCARHGTLELH